MKGGNCNLALTLEVGPVNFLCKHPDMKAGDEDDPPLL
jgi:hypothetical protein